MFNRWKLNLIITNGLPFHTDNCWNNIGKRCYLINEANFLKHLASSNLCIRAICNDQSIYSCNVGLGSFHGTKDTIICKGIMKLYPLDKSLKNLHMHVAMHIFNVDHTHPTIFHRGILAINRNTQTDCCRINRKIQTSVLMRHAAVQKRTKEAAVQFSTTISQQQLTQTIGKIISQTLATNENITNNIDNDDNNGYNNK
ncbi:hypothetical protein DINM_000795 [Dirofilaria immitis]|nr:hypothetical protein [Dirofilaria immitis]